MAREASAPCQTALSAAYFIGERKSSLTDVLNGATALSERFADEGSIVTKPLQGEDVLERAHSGFELFNTASGALVPLSRVAEISIAEGRIAKRAGIADKGRPGDAWLLNAARLAWRAKLQLHLMLDLFNQAREKAEAQAIDVFGDNLKDLLLSAPAGPRAVLGLDPGLRTGVKRGSRPNSVANATVSLAV